MTSTIPAVMAPSVISPDWLATLPAPSANLMTTVPLPASISAEAVSMIAAPGSRSASMTPLDCGAFAIRVRSPLSVTMLALTRMDRPASKLSAPPSPTALLTSILLLTVMSFDA